jgi:hypothetical protein
VEIPSRPRRCERRLHHLDRQLVDLPAAGAGCPGVQDYFTPEINSQAIGYPAGQDWTSDNAATMRYDSYKVRAVLNEIDSFDHSRISHVLNSSTFGNVLLMFGKSCAAE